MNSEGKPWACYCLVSQSGSTYIGSTIDIDRRLRQHNGELSGGAFATKRGAGWRRVCHIVGFPDERAALQFEWRWKQLSRKEACLLYTSPSPRDLSTSRMPSSA